jgi:nucleoside-diphosphate-sugar epimerase
VNTFAGLPRRPHVLVAGASGLVGSAAARHFLRTGWRVTAVSRRRPVGLADACHLPLDLREGRAAAAAIGALDGVTHLVFAAYSEDPGTDGWREPRQMAANLAMLRNVLDPLVAGGALRHVTLLQGTKAYGAPDAVIPIPAKEDAPRAPHAAFYFLQEDHVRERQRGQPWHWTILRPQVVFGDALGSHMNVIPAIGVYAALLKAQGQPLFFPGGVSRVREAVDADLLARACAWAATEPACRNEIFNITNGDVYEWRNAWPAIADALGMASGGDRPERLAETMPRREQEWAMLVRRHGLQAPASLQEFVGQGFAYADRQFCFGRQEPAPERLVSTIKARQAGFHDCVDTEAMFRRIFRGFQDRGWLPRV